MRIVLFSFVALLLCLTMARKSAVNSRSDRRSIGRKSAKKAELNKKEIAKFAKMKLAKREKKRLRTLNGRLEDVRLKAKIRCVIIGGGVNCRLHLKADLDAVQIVVCI